MRYRRALIFLSAAAAVVALPVLAQQRPKPIKTQQQDWDQLPDQWRSQFLREMRDIGALDREDEVEYDGVEQARIIETNQGLPPRPPPGQVNANLTHAAVRSLLPDFCRLFVREKYKAQLAGCAPPKPDAAVSEQCSAVSREQEQRLLLCNDL